MREYNVDTLVEEGNVNLQRRPFPLYPSKAGLDQKIFSDMISRLVHLSLFPPNIALFPSFVFIRRAFVPINIGVFYC